MRAGQISRNQREDLSKLTGTYEDAAKHEKGSKVSTNKGKVRKEGTPTWYSNKSSCLYLHTATFPH